jgi:hypothetical protein
MLHGSVGELLQRSLRQAIVEVGRGSDYVATAALARFEDGSVQDRPDQPTRMLESKQSAMAVASVRGKG